MVKIDASTDELSLVEESCRFGGGKVVSLTQGVWLFYEINAAYMEIVLQREHNSRSILMNHTCCEWYTHNTQE